MYAQFTEFSFSRVLYRPSLASFVLESSEDAAAREHRREVAEESSRGAPLGDYMNIHPVSSLLFFLFCFSPMWSYFFFLQWPLMWPHFFFLQWPLYGRLDIYRSIINEALGVFMGCNFLQQTGYRLLDIYCCVTNYAIGIFMRYNFS